MGYRSTITTSDYGATLPEWFRIKYKDCFTFNGTLVSSRMESKFRNSHQFFEDFQRAIKGAGFWSSGYDLPIYACVLAEDGFVTRVIIRETSIQYEWAEFMKADHVWNMGNYNGATP